jgi:fibronectin type 3 domain-containing protein
MHRTWNLVLVSACAILLYGCVATPKGDPNVLDIPKDVALEQEGLREVAITWGAPHDGSITYAIERAPAADGPFEKVGEAPSQKGSFIDRGAAGEPLEDSTTYYYRLVAVSPTGAEGEPSTPLSSTTAPPPNPPEGLEATAPKSRGVKLAWQASASPDVVKYRVERTEAAEPENFAVLAEVAATEYMDGGTASSTLKDSTLYLYRVLSVNRVSSVGAASEPVQVTTMPPPDPPKNVAAESRQVRCVPLTWDASPEEDVIRYDVYRSSSAKGPFEKIGEVRNRETPKYLDGGRDPGNIEDDETYYYRVRAVNDVTAESADSRTFDATTREVPPRVREVRAQVRQPREVPLAWDASDDEKVLGYEIWRAEGDGDYTQVGRVGGRHITTFVDRDGHKQFPGVSQLKDDTIYNYKIIAFNTAYARSSASEPVTSQTKPSPAMPIEVVATEMLPRRIKLTWTANSETDIVAYAVSVSPDGRDFRPLCTVPSRKGEKSSGALEDGLADGQKRHYRVQAIDKDRLVSPYSETVLGRAKPVPDAPALVRQEDVDAGVRLYWDPPSQPDIKAYKLYTRTLFGSESYAVTEVPEFVIEWPLLKGDMKIMISSVDADNLEGEKCEPISVSGRSR